MYDGKEAIPVLSSHRKESRFEEFFHLNVYCLHQLIVLLLFKGFDEAFEQVGQRHFAVGDDD